MTRPLLTTLGLAVLALFAAEPGNAQTSAGTSVFGAGGGGAGNDLTRIRATAGQAIIGIVHADDPAARQGFWHTLGRSALSDLVAQPVTGVAGELRLSCAPNPVSSSTSLRVDIPQAGHVSLRLFDVNGRQVHTLIDEERTPGTATVVFDAAELSSGAYTAELISNGQRRQLSIFIVK